MSFTWLKRLGIGVVRHAPVAFSIASKLGVPYAGSISAIIQIAASRGGTGEQRMDRAVELALIHSRLTPAQIEAHLGKKVAHKDVAIYVRTIIQAHYDLMKSVGEVTKP